MGDNAAQVPVQQPQGQQQEEEWRLAGGEMRIVDHGKKKPTDPFMILHLEFTFDRDPRPKKVGMIVFSPSEICKIDKYLKPTIFYTIWDNKIDCVLAYTYNDPSFKNALGPINSSLGKTNSTVHIFW